MSNAVNVLSDDISEPDDVEQVEVDMSQLSTVKLKGNINYNEDEEQPKQSALETYIAPHTSETSATSNISASARSNQAKEEKSIIDQKRVHQHRLSSMTLTKPRSVTERATKPGAVAVSQIDDRINQKIALRRRLSGDYSVETATESDIEGKIGTCIVNLIESEGALGEQQVESAGQNEQSVNQISLRRRLSGASTGLIRRLSGAPASIIRRISGASTDSGDQSILDNVVTRETATTKPLAMEEGTKTEATNSGAEEKTKARHFLRRRISGTSVETGSLAEKKMDSKAHSPIVPVSVALVKANSSVQQKDLKRKSGSFNSGSIASNNVDFPIEDRLQEIAIGVPEAISIPLVNKTAQDKPHARRTLSGDYFLPDQSHTKETTLTRNTSIDSVVSGFSMNSVTSNLTGKTRPSVGATIPGAVSVSVVDEKIQQKVELRRHISGASAVSRESTHKIFGLSRKISIGSVKSSYSCASDLDAKIKDKVSAMREMSGHLNDITSINRSEHLGGSIKHAMNTTSADERPHAQPGVHFIPTNASNYLEKVSKDKLENIDAENPSNQNDWADPFGDHTPTNRKENSFFRGTIPRRYRDSQFTRWLPGIFREEDGLLSDNANCEVQLQARKSRNRLCICLYFALPAILLIGIVVGLPIGLIRQGIHNDRKAPTLAPTVINDWIDLATLCDSEEKIDVSFIPEETVSRVQQYFQKDFNHTTSLDLISCSPQHLAMFAIGLMKVDATPTRYALTVLFFATRGQRWKNADQWLSQADPCDGWFGVSCGSEGIISINMADNNLNGILPTELLNLTTMEKIVLADNSVGGLKLEDFTNFLNLEVLDLRGSSMTGNLPTTFESLTNLRKFYISSDLLGGTIARDIGYVTGLQELYIRSPSLSEGSIPSHLGSLTNLAFLSLEGNFNSEFPNEIWRLPNLTHLEVSNLASFNNSLPDWVFDENTAWTHIDLSGNGYFKGTIPTTIGMLTELRFFDLSGTELSGSIPPEIGHCTSLQIFNIDNSKLEGSLPTELGTIEALQNLEAQNNQHSGTIPTELAKLTNLKYVDLSGQLSRLGFSGMMPLGICEIETLNQFSVTCGTSLADSCPNTCCTCISIR